MPTTHIELDPYTEAERERDRLARNEVNARLHARKKARRSGHTYGSQSTPETRRITSRIIGERDDD